MNPSYEAIAQRAGHRCEYCHAPEAPFNFPFEVEHIQPRSSGGPTDPDNLALGCRSCNLYKGSHTSSIDPVTGEGTPLFHPRRDHWERHFAVQLDGSIIGNTAVARATIDCLHINSPRQIAARKLWLTMRIYK